MSKLVVVPKERVRKVVCPKCGYEMYIIIEEEAPPPSPPPTPPKGGSLAELIERKLDEEMRVREEKRVNMNAMIRAAQRFVYGKAPGEEFTGRELQKFLVGEGVIPRNLEGSRKVAGYMRVVLVHLQRLGFIERVGTRTEGSGVVTVYRVKGYNKDRGQMMRELRKAEMLR
ncbi:MAG: hypothetical protein DRN49_04625 [Thaumarchaeota archaeon]|nr:MAG: hypothetical protein DRN49_04625 [Nitrososphaerota archaeon]